MRTGPGGGTPAEVPPPGPQPPYAPAGGRGPARGRLAAQPFSSVKSRVVVAPFLIFTFATVGW